MKLFGEYLRLDNVLQNYDEYVAFKQQGTLTPASSPNVIEEPAAPYGTPSEAKVTALSEHQTQDYRSTYNDIREWLHRERDSEKENQLSIDWNDVVFEVDLLKSQEINLDYILELIFEKHKQSEDKQALIEDIRSTIRASLGNRAKESLIVDFIEQTDLTQFDHKADVIDAFFAFSQGELQKEAEALISDENLNIDAAKRYLTTSLKREYASENGTELNEMLPKISPLNPKYLGLKQRVFGKVSAFVEKFKQIARNIE